MTLVSIARLQLLMWSHKMTVGMIVIAGDIFEQTLRCEMSIFDILWEGYLEEQQTFCSTYNFFHLILEMSDEVMFQGDVSCFL